MVFTLLNDLGRSFCCGLSEFHVFQGWISHGTSRVAPGTNHPGLRTGVARPGTDVRQEENFLSPIDRRSALRWRYRPLSVPFDKRSVE